MSNPFNIMNPMIPITNNARNVYQAFMNSRNPMQMFMQMANGNPQLQQIANMLNSGMNPQQLFNNMCQQRGINPQQFLAQITGNNNQFSRD